MSVKSVVVCILDGWGNGEHGEYNAISSADKPCWDKIIATYPFSSLVASGTAVGVPPGQMGNSEVGHATIGSGRVIEQDLQRINEAIVDIHQNPTLLKLIEQLKHSSGVCHVMGLLSDGGVHSHQLHIFKIIETLSLHGVKVAIHAILDGRDTSPRSAIGYINELQRRIQNLANVSIATISGRYYTMDRDQRSDRTLKAYDAMFFARGKRSNNVIALIEESYDLKIYDEFIEPTVIGDYSGANPQDGLLALNFRADRMIQIIEVILGNARWDYERVKLSTIVGITKYREIDIPSLFPPVIVPNSLGQVISDHGLKQLRMAETEKSAHVTFFFNGGTDQIFPEEEHIIIPSPKVRTYDLQPEMSAFELTESLISSIKEEKFSLIVVNFANADMVAHSGDIMATEAAIRAIDRCLSRVLATVRSLPDTVLIITADHGNAEKMFDVDTGMPHTSHTTNSVPFVLCNYHQDVVLRDGGLSDIAVTVLDLLKIAKPPEMTGKSLIDYQLPVSSSPPNRVGVSPTST